MRNSNWGSLKWLPIALRRALTLTTALATPAVVLAQHDQGGHKDVTLHINPRWRECSFQLDAALTKSAWQQFTGEAGVVTFFRPLADAAPMGRGRYEVSVVQWTTDIDDTEAAWNDTFVHPDSVHYLLEGESLAFPGLTLRAGVTDRTDVGAYVTKSPGANYGFYGAQVQHNVLRDAAQKWAASARLSFVKLYGPEDADFTVYGVEAVASRTYTVSKRLSVSPYAGVATTLSHSHEKSAVVDLDDEFVMGALGTIGVVAQLSAAKVGLEYNVARVPSMSLKIGFGPGSR